VDRQPDMVHHACSKQPEVTVPSLDDWEKEWVKNSVVAQFEI
jgi:hypothetical protein